MPIVRLDEKMELVRATEYELIKNNKEIEAIITRHLDVQGDRLIEAQYTT